MTLALARQYFGVGQADDGKLRVSGMYSIGQSFDAQVNGLDDLGTMDASPEEAQSLARRSGQLEASALVFKEWSRQKIRYGRARVAMASAVGNHHVAAARVSLQAAQVQQRYGQQMTGLGLQMGITAAAQQGFTEGIENSRTALFA